MEVWIGRGSFGDVYLREENGQKCVVKYVEEDVAENYLKERDTLELLTHTNIVGYIGTRRGANGRFGILLEYCELGPLKDLIVNETIVYSIRSVVEWARELFGALEFLEEHHIVHRDIKPDNVFVTAFYNTKLGDFGSCKIIEGTLTGASIAGTARYTRKNFIQLDSPMCRGNFKKFVESCVNFNYDDRFSISEAMKEIKDLIKTDKTLLEFDLLPEAQQDHKIPIRPIGFDEKFSKARIPIRFEDPSLSIPDPSIDLTNASSNEKSDQNQKATKYFPKLRGSDQEREKFFAEFLTASKKDRDEFTSRISDYIEFHFQTFNSYYYHGIDEMKDKMDLDNMEILFAACLMIDYISQLQHYHNTFELIDDLGKTNFGGWLIYRELLNLKSTLSNLKKFCYTRRIYFKCYFSTYTREEWLLLRYVEGRECQFVSKDLKTVRTYWDKTTGAEQFAQALSKVFKGREVPKQLYLRRLEKGKRFDIESIVGTLDECEEMTYLSDEPLDIYMLVNSLEDKLKKLGTSLEIKCDSFILPPPEVDSTMKPMVDRLKLKDSAYPGYIFQLKNPPRSNCLCSETCPLICGVPYPEEIPYQMKLSYFKCSSNDMRRYLEFYANFRIGMDIALRKEKRIEVIDYDPENLSEEFSRGNYFLFSLIKVKMNGKIEELLMLDTPSNCSEFESIPCIDFHFTLFTIEASKIVKLNLIPKISLVPIFYDKEFKFTLLKPKERVIDLLDSLD
ncbi:unnamed protein product, partial [Mesorhabditis belari]|uniref:Protein kinase domain-containing protein n=1 Tax=Mesorhabditis belari TaxID=2138241 RepID=A0AAF3FIQ5_9BILA